MFEKVLVLIKEKNSDKLKEFISSHPDFLEEQNENGTSGFMLLAYSGLQEVFATAITIKKSFSFHEAIIAGRKDMVHSQLLKNVSENINAYSPDGFSPIALACFFGQDEIAELLVLQGADPNLQATNPSKVNALHAAVAKENIKLCRLLLDHGADVNRAQMQEVTPLHSAVHRGNVELTKLLVKKGADIHARMTNGDTPISIAEREKHVDVLEFLRSI